MSQSPPAVEKLLSAAGSAQSEAWGEFAREYSALLLHVARSVCNGSDEAMDAYAYLLDRLSEDDCRRLRGYAVTPESKFTTWLVVVARRLCIDHHRTKYGRVRDTASAIDHERKLLRRRLEDLSGPPDDAAEIADENHVTADRQVEAAELSAELRCALASLPSGDRLLMVLRFEDGLSAAEIAPILRYPSPFHVYRRINSVLATLRAQLQSRGFETAAS